MYEVLMTSGTVVECVELRPSQDRLSIWTTDRCEYDISGNDITPPTYVLAPGTWLAYRRVDV